MTKLRGRADRAVEQIAGSALIPPKRMLDNRGEFGKVLSSAVRDEFCYDFAVREIFWNTSHRGVVRGMHLLLSDQLAAKAIWVTSGRIRSVVLDLRRSSKTFGEYSEQVLDSAAGILIIPMGCANGFEALADGTIVNFAQEQDFDSSREVGIRWNSFGCNWLTTNPVVSERDQQLPHLNEFESPFE